eukprot:jgi/Picre1/28971/NNA_004365.t1
MGRSKSKAKLAAKSRLKRDIEKSAAAKNAFEQIRTRKKFNVLGKKTKGDTKRTTQLRSAAVEKRKDTLLVDINNETLSRMPESRIVDDDDEDDGTDLLEQYNFGGGKEEGGGSPRHKTKKEIMEEVIAKSKMFKAMKAKQREEDLDETDALDVAWKELAQENLTSDMMRPKGSRAEEERREKVDIGGGKKFDSLTRELVFEAKAQAGERTLTKEELADLERQRLEELEKQRVHREKGGDDLEDDFEGISGLGAAPTGGYAARRARMKEKMRQQEEEEEEGTSDDEDDSEYEDGMTAVEKRRQEQASGNHPLQEQFRDVALELLKRHKMGDTKGILKNGSNLSVRARMNQGNLKTQRRIPVKRMWKKTISLMKSIPLQNKMTKFRA